MQPIISYTPTPTTPPPGKYDGAIGIVLFILFVLLMVACAASMTLRRLASERAERAARLGFELSRYTRK